MDVTHKSQRKLSWQIFAANFHSVNAAFNSSNTKWFFLQAHIANYGKSNKLFK